MQHYRMTLGEFARHKFVGRPPARATLKAMVDRGDLPGERRGSTYFVFVDEHGEPLSPAKPQAALPASTGNALADELLRDWASTR